MPLQKIFSSSRILNNPAFFLKTKKANKILQDYDFITPRLFKLKDTVLDHRLAFCYKKDMDLLRETIKEVSPEYLETYDKVMKGNKTFLCNLFVTTRKNLDGYCSWLFKVLFALEPKIDISNYEGNYKRIYGYMSEVLLTVYIFQNNLKWKKYPVTITQYNPVKKVFDKIKKIIERGFNT